MLAVAAFVIPAAARRLTVNLRPSVPRGVYLLRPGEAVHAGTTVMIPIPALVRDLVSERGYLPSIANSLLKEVLAVGGDSVCIEDRVLIVNDEPLFGIAAEDDAGAPLPEPFPFCGRLPPGYAFIMGDGPSSLDSRYFGPVPLAMLTPARLIWTF